MPLIPPNPTDQVVDHVLCFGEEELRSSGPAYSGSGPTRQDNRKQEWLAKQREEGDDEKLDSSEEEEETCLCPCPSLPYKGSFLLRKERG